MDSLRAARYPFLREALAFAENNSADPDLLVSDPNYSDARKRGIERVLGAMDRHDVGDRPLLTEYDRLMEVLSYTYARMIVSCVNDRYLTKRYALAEASRMNGLLGGEERASADMVAQELGIRFNDKDGKVSIHFTDYLRYSCVMKAVEWKLINSDIRNGYVFLESGKFDRLLQNVLQEKIESELPLKMIERFRDPLRKDTDRIAMMLAETKKRLSPTGGAGMNPEFLPPCIKTILANAQNGMNLPHSARFALVSFLNALGMTYDQIITLFSQSPDFDESKSSYQIKHITGELSGTDGYTPPECSTMKTNGICSEPDGICGRISHPLSYYRMKSGAPQYPGDRKG